MKRKRIASVVLAGVALLAMAGCTHVNSGTVTEKRHVPARSDTYLMCMSYGKYGCTFFAPITDNYPERWEVQLSDETGKHHEWHDLSRSAYSHVHVGEHLNLTKP